MIYRTDSALIKSHAVLNHPDSPEDSNLENTRFTLDGDDELERHLNKVCHLVLAGMLEAVPEKKLQAIILGGGYGRGEGGVLRTPAGDEPYNDMEFYVLLHGPTWLNNQRYGPALSTLAEELRPAAKVEIEFKILSLAGLQRSRPSMFYYDLVCGHRWVLGHEQLLAACDHHRQSFRLPASEAIRLLLNRCTGILLSRPYLEHEIAAEDKSNFIRRNLAKLQLALGDAVLTVFGQYYWSCLERHTRLLRLTPKEDMPWLEEVQRHHAEGVEFKLHPIRAAESWETLCAEFARLSALSLQLWLWLESHRLRQHFTNIRDYAFNPMNKCPESQWLRNRICNTIAFGPEMLWHTTSNRSPRERLLNTLPLLLWEKDHLKEPDTLKKLQSDLVTFSSTIPGLINAYQKLWIRFR